MPIPVTHFAYSDETNPTKGRFRGVAAISLRAEDEPRVTSELRLLIEQSGVHELAWKKLRQRRDRFAAEKVLTYVVDLVCAKTARVDALLWDITDTRHAIPGRNDIANLERMYHHLFVVLLTKRWPDDARWAIYPDENSALDWESFEYFLRGKALTGRRPPGEMLRRLATSFNLDHVTPVDSAASPLVQVADLMVGLAVFSRQHYVGFSEWQGEQSGQESLIPRSSPRVNPTGSQAERYVVLDTLNRLCKAAKLGVSLKSKKYLDTPNPTRPISFWWWTPQTNADKAPTRDER